MPKQYWGFPDSEECSKCEDEIGLTDVEGHYVGICKRCRKKDQYSSDDWGSESDYFTPADYEGHECQKNVLFVVLNRKRQITHAGQV